jgi:uncharacterized integral membrane protein
MRIKTILIVVITVLLTTALVQNNKPIDFNFFWATFTLSELVMLLIIAIVSFVLGLLVGRPGRASRKTDDAIASDPSKIKPGTLSDSDRDYIN